MSLTGERASTLEAWRAVDVSILRRVAKRERRRRHVSAGSARRAWHKLRLARL